MSKVIICGGRKYKERPDDFSKIRAICEEHEIKEIVSGGARGADAVGERFANYYKYNIATFDAEWDLHGRSAGPIRNSQMLEYIKMHNGIVIAFPGGRGTDHMKSIANYNSIEVIEIE